MSETPATVEIFVCNSKGEPLENKTVGLYDESRYTDFQEDHTIKPLAEVITNQKGIAHFVLESRPWFLKGTYYQSKRNSSFCVGKSSMVFERNIC